MMASDRGWETVAERLIAVRSRIGAEVIRTWCGTLPRGASVLDLGCGAGIPVSEELVKAGVTLYGIDASPTLVAAFRQRFPEANSACETVESSTFFSRTFDAVAAVGLLFLLPADAQLRLIRKVAQALNPGGSFLLPRPHRSVPGLIS